MRLRLKRILKTNLWIKLKQWFKQDYRVLLTAGSVTSFIIILRLSGLLQSWELAALDQLFRIRPLESKEERILIVEITEEDIKKVKQWPISDKIIAELLYKLNSHQPRAIGLDILRDLPVEPGHEEFLEAINDIPNLIGIETLNTNPNLVVPAPSLLTQKDQVGFNNLVIDVDGKVRRSLFHWYENDEVYTSFPLKLAFAYLEAEGITPQAAATNSEYLQLEQTVFPIFKSNDGVYVNADDGGYQVLTNFRHPNSFEIVSMSDVLADRIPSSLIGDRLILIGITAPSIKDFFYSPYSGGLWTNTQPIFGVELHANFISQILNATLSGRPLIKTWSEGIEWLWIFAWSLVSSSVIWHWRSPLRAAVILVSTGLTLTGIVYLGFIAGWCIPLIPPVIGLIGSAFVVTSYIAHQEKELKRSKEFLQSLIDKIPDPIFVKDKEYRWIILNEAFCQFIGCPLEELLGKSDSDFFEDQEANIFRSQDELVFQTSKAQENEEEFTNAKGTTYLTETKRSIHQDAAGNIFLVGVIRDITERKRIEEELRRTAAELTRYNIELKRSESRLRYLADHDSLTGLANRKLFYESLSELLKWGDSNNKLVGLLFLDLDGFKPVNDKLGHDMGDLLLKAVSQRIKNCLRSSDIVSRLGGDEFTVILPGIKKIEDVTIVADKILSTLSQAFMLEGNSIVVTVSIGISIYPVDGETEAVLIKNADTAMYQAKELGRNQYQLASKFTLKE